MTDTVHTSTFRPTLDNEGLVELCERQIAVKVAGLLPLDEESAMRVLDLAAGLVAGFLSSEAIRSGGLFALEKDKEAVAA